MSWLQKLLPPRIKASSGAKRKAVPEGLWIKCAACEAVLYRTDLENNLFVCPKCAHHSRVPARERIDQLLDPEGPLRDRLRGRAGRQPQVQGQRKYPERLAAALEETGETDALVVMQGSVRSVPLVLAALRVRVHGRLDGLGGRRALRPRRARRLREPRALRLHLGLRRRAHAGGRQLAVPDGEDDRGAAGARAARGCRSCRSSPIRRWAASRRPSRSSATWCIAEPGALDRLRRAARDRADRAREAARGLPARRVPDAKRARST